MADTRNKVSEETEYNHDGDLWVVRYYDNAGDVGNITEFCDDEGDQAFWVFGKVPRAAFPWAIIAYEAGMRRGKAHGEYEMQVKIQKVLGLDRGLGI